jgi:hypothetical protein
MTINFYVEFLQKDEISLQRTIEAFEMIKSTKAAIEIEDIELDEDNMPISEIYDLPFIDYLTNTEKAYFSNLSSEEHDEWQREWFSTPIVTRHSPQMICPQWDLGSMLDTFWNGEYDLITIQENNDKYYLTFNPHAYPYGGTGCMVAFLECFGHKVIGIQDGTGYREHTPRNEFWQPKKR